LDRKNNLSKKNPKKNTSSKIPVGMPAPSYIHEEGMLNDSDWLESYIRSVLMWPQDCKFDLKTRHLIGLAKAIAYFWEPGVLIHVDQALANGASRKEITDTIRIASVTVGLADLENSLKTICEMKLINSNYKFSQKESEIFSKVFKDAEKTLVFLSQIHKSNFQIKDNKWLSLLYKTSRILYKKTELDSKTQQFICIAVSAIRHWVQGLHIFGRNAIRKGASEKEISDVVNSTFKTGTSTSMQVGFRCPCFVPDMKKYVTIADHYLNSRLKK
jgi:alkylhydroperoxidase/carboxymuconolactone decarboxylase family protein YurZ